MAIYTAKTKKIRMLFVLKGDDRKLSIQSLVDLGYGYGDVGMRASDNIGWIRCLSRQYFTLNGNVADDTLGVVTPFTVAGKALPVIGTLEIGFG